MRVFQKYLICFFFCLYFFKFWAQEDIKIWTGYSAQARITKSWRIAAGQLLLFNQKPFALASMQNNTSLQYRFHKRLRVAVGYLQSTKPNSPDQEARNRISTGVRYLIRYRKLKISNALRAEWHFPERSKYEYRIRFGFRIHRGNWGLPLRMTPYINNELLYYLAGRPLQYRDEAGDRVVRQPPDGLHAHRFALGISFRPFRNASASLSYMQQNEFNIGSKYRAIHVVDPRDGDIKRSFNNFSVMMFRFSYKIDFRNRNTLKAENQSSENIPENY